MRTVTFAFIALVLLAGPLPAQSISLTDKQREKLVGLVESDAEAKGCFQKIKRQADEALKDEASPIKKIQTEGKLDGDPSKARTRESLGDMRKISSLAWAFAVEGEKSYRDKALEFILSWARENKPTGDPIDETNLDDVFVAYDLLKKDCPDKDRKTIEDWLRRVADAEVKSFRKGGYNNWNSHRVKIVGMIGWCLRDRRMIGWTVDAYKEQISHNLKPDGSSIDFHDRDALHYHTYDVEPLLAVAICGRLNGTDLYHYKSSSGASLGKGVEFLVPYATGEKTHAEFVHTKAAFDRERAKNGQGDYTPGHLWSPGGAGGVFELNSFFDKEGSLKMLRTIGKKFKSYPSWQTVVIDVQRD